MDTSQLLPLDATLTRLFEDGDPDALARPRERGHVECVSRVFGAVVAADYDAFAAELTDDVEIEIHGAADLPFIRRARGRVEARELVAHNFAALADQEPRIVSLTAQGDTMVVIGRETGRVRATGKPYDLHFIYQFTFREGKLAKIREYESVCG